MGEKKKEAEKAGVFTRAFLIFAALALVIIGANPFYRKYGGVINYLDHISKAFAEGWSRGPHSAKGGVGQEKRAMLADEPGGSMSLFQGLFGGGERGGEHGTAAKKDTPAAPAGKPLDKVTESDRSKLDSLVSGL